MIIGGIYDRRLLRMAEERMRSEQKKITEKGSGRTKGARIDHG